MGKTYGRVVLWVFSLALTILMVAGIAAYRVSTGDEQAIIPWGMMVVGYVFFAIMSGGVADSTIITAYIIKRSRSYPELRRNIYTALAVLVPGIVLVFSDILHPGRSYWFYLGFNIKSRIAWNALLYIIYAGFLAALLVVLIRRGEEGAEAPLTKGLAFATLVASVNLEMNLGMAFGSNIAVPTWYSVYSGMLFIACAFALGGAWLALTNRVRLEGIVSAEEWWREDRRIAAEIAITVLTVGFVVLWGLLGLYSWGLAEGFTMEVAKGDYAAYFWLGYVVLGFITPLALAILVLLKEGKGRILQLAGLLVIIGIAVLLAVPYNYGGQHYRLEVNQLYGQLALGLGDAQAYTLEEYLANPETLAFIGGFGLAILLDLIGPILLPLKPGDKPRRLWILK